MSENSTDMTGDQLEAVQAVVDRVSSWQDGATEGTVEDELRKGFAEVGVDVSADKVTALAEAIEARHGAVSAAEVLA
ncbi:hypothetical protein [Nocardioides ferulae]|uniref:hypothetical protein n=1 Tax=Nocardioides ferulae TaxID=2340821 RepID=UPI000EAE530E|nr:hypothetical protein [Nocardioides ferulae]